LNNAKIISISLIFILLSSFSSSFGDTISQNYKQEITPPKFIEKPSVTELTRDFTLALDEKKLQLTNQEISITLLRQPIVEYITNIHISEDITISNDDGSENQFIFSNTIATKQYWKEYLTIENSNLTT